MEKKAMELNPCDELFLDIGIGLNATVILLRMPDDIYDITKQSLGLEALKITLKKAPDDIKDDTQYVLNEYFWWLESMRELRSNGH